MPCADTYIKLYDLDSINSTPMNSPLLIGTLVVITLLVLGASLPNRVYEGNDRTFVLITIGCCVLTLGALVMFIKI